MTGFTQNYGLARVFGGTTGAAGISRENAQNLPDIFDDVLGSLLPTNIYDAFTISEYMMTTTPPFASVTNRVVRYFLTSIGITGASGANKEKSSYAGSCIFSTAWGRSETTSSCTGTRS